MLDIFYFAIVGKRSIVISVSVCLSSCAHISETGCPNFTKFSALVTVARFSFGGVVICYLFPVLWMRSYLHNGRNKTMPNGRTLKRYTELRRLSVRLL